MEIDGRATVLIGRTGMDIELHDADSGVTFARFHLSPEQALQAIGRLSYGEVEKANVYRLDKVGMQRENDRIEFAVAMVGGKTELYGDARKKAARERFKKECPEGGWELNDSFMSQDSFFFRDDALWARASIVRWVPKEGSAEEFVQRGADIVKQHPEILDMPKDEGIALIISIMQDKETEAADAAAS